MLPKAEKIQHNPQDHNDGPTTMIYDTNLGWIDESPGPTTRYWKRITRIGENKSLTKTPINTEVKKRAGLTLLQELDPNSISVKHKKGKKVVGQNEEKNFHMDGGMAVAAVQPPLA